MASGLTYGIPIGLLISAFMTGSYHAWLAGVVALTACLCTSRILHALKQAPSSVAEQERKQASAAQ